MVLNRLYYQCIPEGKEYPVLCRKPAVETEGWMNTIFSSLRGGFGREQVLLDWNELAEKHGKLFQLIISYLSVVIYFSSYPIIFPGTLSFDAFTLGFLLQYILCSVTNFSLKLFYKFKTISLVLFVLGF